MNVLCTNAFHSMFIICFIIWKSPSPLSIVDYREKRRNKENRYAQKKTSLRTFDSLLPVKSRPSMQKPPFLVYKKWRSDFFCAKKWELTISKFVLLFVLFLRPNLSIWRRTTFVCDRIHCGFFQASAFSSCLDMSRLFRKNTNQSLNREISQNHYHVSFQL